MLSVTDGVFQIIRKNPFICESLSLGLLNTSEYARIIKNQLEQNLAKPLRTQTIVTSLNRLKGKFQVKTGEKFVVDDIQLKYPMSYLVYKNTDKDYTIISKLYEKTGQQENNFLSVIKGNTETSIFLHSSLEFLVKEVYQKVSPIYFRSSLASITLKFSSKYVEIAGSTFSILRSLAMDGINVIEVLSTYTEISIFVESLDLQRVIEIVKNDFLKVTINSQF